MEENVSIIISTYKNQDYLVDCVSSIKNQDFDGKVEIILGIDDCQDTLNFVEKNPNLFDGVEVIYFSENSGPYTLKNNLINLSKYEMIVFFDSDDIMLPNFIKTFFKNIKEDNIFRFRYKNFDNESKIFENNEEFAWGVFGLSKSTFKKVGYFQNWRCSGDYEFIKRANFLSVVVNSNFDLTFHRRVHRKSLTKNFSTNFSSEIRKKYQETVVSRIHSKIWEKPEFIKMEHKKIN